MWRGAVVFLLLIAGSASAHVPTFNEAGQSAETASVVSDPSKSWVFYEELAAGEQHWFTFQVDAGQSIVTSLSLPSQETARPILWVVGPGLGGATPRGTPPGLGAVRAETQESLGVEPFAPLAMRSVASWEGTAPGDGTYYVVIESNDDASYALGLGRAESFTPVEWLSVPLERPAIQSWGGVPWPLAILGELFGIGLVLVWMRRVALTWQSTIGHMGAAAIGGTAISTLILGTIAAARGGVSAALIVPLVFALAAAGIGFGAYRSVRFGRRPWAGIAWAGAGVLVWAGMVLGPLLLVGWSIWKWRQPRAA